ncbi:hypothetical protein [Nocardiopsis suaedae]|uniref:Uncharacterized protein n=1 Tax=Nocardiopsis suaedae TaxID=3018444 RepID=A0ABT4TKS4_9ACTN|nr:hypothetical protein [Nocardiopsis suaedae]MDA2805307.1 hypothetical protein [Nocardiopsis suaedae]
MDPRQRSITLRWAVPAAVLIAAAGLFTAPSFFYSGLLPIAAGALTAGAAATALLWWTLPSVRSARGGPAVFLLIWGACVLAGAVSDGTARVVSVEQMQSGSVPGSAHGESFGWFAYTPLTSSDGPPGTYEQINRQMTATGPGISMVGGGVSVAPDWGGVAAGVVLGWAAGGIGVVAYRRTSPAGASERPE